MARSKHTKVGAARGQGRATPSTSPCGTAAHTSFNQQPLAPCPFQYRSQGVAHCLSHTSTTLGHLTEVKGCTHWLQSVMDISVQMLMTVLSVSVLPIALQGRQVKAVGVQQGAGVTRKSHDSLSPLVQLGCGWIPQCGNATQLLSHANTAWPQLNCSFVTAQP